MNTIKSVLCFALVLTLAASCNKATYRKTPGGMPYQLFRSKDTMAVKGGNTIKVSFTQKINDSVVFTNEGKPPFYIAVDPTPHPYDLSEVWTKLHKGDSVITTQMIDSFIKRNPMNINPRFKKGDRIFNYIKVLDVFTNG